MTNFGRELKAQRAACGLSQSQAAACFQDLSVRTLQAWETSEQSPPLWVQHVILERFAKPAAPAQSPLSIRHEPSRRPVERSQKDTAFQQD